MRKDPLVVGEIYHIISRSIADFRIFNNNYDYNRALNLLQYYQLEHLRFKFSAFIKLIKVQKVGFDKSFSLLAKEHEKIIAVVAYCLMPTHIHLILKPLKSRGVSAYMNNVLNSYTRYFNTRHKRKGPLWESRFKSVLVKDDSQLLHLTRYIHLNPVTAYLVKKPKEWHFSSYLEFIRKDTRKIVELKNLFEINPLDYQKFVEDRIDYQRQLAKIKKLMLD